jgi:asparagine synthase (glutamine-hydrolysing)
LADVPVGVFLSSGLDSTTLAALVAESGAELRSVTLGFEEYRGTAHDEVPLAELVAQRYGARHETVWVKREDFRARLPALLDAMDQPSLDGVNSYFVSLAAARVGLKVALSGLGGDEVFGGYPSFQEIPRAVRRLRWLTWVPGLGRAFRFVSASLLRRFTSPKYASLLEYGGRYAGAYLLRRGLFMPWELPRFLDGEMVRQGWEALRPLARLDDTLSGLRDARRRVAALEMTWYMRNQLLRDTDWASMAHSLEVRVPLVDVEVLRAVAPHFSDPPPPSKLLLAQCPSQPLPDALLRRPKTGFTVPVRDWLRGDAAAPGERGLRGWARFVHAAFQRN